MFLLVSMHTEGTHMPQQTHDEKWMNMLSHLGTKIFLQRVNSYFLETGLPAERRGCCQRRWPTRWDHFAYKH